MPFSSLGLSPALQQAIRAAGFSSPTPIQSTAIPSILAGRDVVACAATGSGKTLAFGWPLLQQFEGRPVTSTRTTSTLVLVPTRELAAQVGEAFRLTAQRLATATKIAIVYGGVSANPQMMALRGGADIVIATPGRLLDLLGHNALTLLHVNALVLDEADKLLEMGFMEEVSKILDKLPPKRQNILISATFPSAVQTLAQRIVRDPVYIDIPPAASDGPPITQRAIAVDESKRTQLLRHLIKQHGWTQVLVFVATKHAAEIVADKLRKGGVKAEPLHGTLSQGKRTQVLADIKTSRITVVVATDLVARGIDIPQLPIIVNFDLPRSPTDYTHRIGRTGRAGQAGTAISFISPANEVHFRLIEKRNHAHVEREIVTGFEPTGSFATSKDTKLLPEIAPSQGGVKGKRPSKKDKLRAGADIRP